MMTKHYRLSEKQNIFLRHYLPPGGNFNATEAARLAGYSWPNKAGPRVSHSPKIVPLIDAWFFDNYGHYQDDTGQWVYQRPDTSRIVVGKT